MNPNLSAYLYTEMTKSCFTLSDFDEEHSHRMTEQTVPKVGDFLFYNQLGSGGMADLSICYKIIKITPKMVVVEDDDRFSKKEHMYLKRKVSTWSGQTWVSYVSGRRSFSNLLTAEEHREMLQKLLRGEDI
jgi:hypothetical protein